MSAGTRLAVFTLLAFCLDSCATVQTSAFELHANVDNPESRSAASAGPIAASTLALAAEDAARTTSCSTGAYWIGASVISDAVSAKHECPGWALCEPGTACIDGARKPCPDGSYSDSIGSVRCAPCEAGFRCTQTVDPVSRLSIGSSSSRQLPCVEAQDARGGSVGVGAAYYCPAGSGEAATGVSVGYYTSATEPYGRKTAQFQCEPGYYCVAGMRYKCPAGRFGHDYGLSTPSCSGACEPGFACPAGSISPRQLACGSGPDTFCPSGSGFGLPVGLDTDETFTNLNATGSNSSSGDATAATPSLEQSVVPEELDAIGNQRASEFRQLTSLDGVAVRQVGRPGSGLAPLDGFDGVSTTGAAGLDAADQTDGYIHSDDGESDRAAQRSRVAQTICPRGYSCSPDGLRHACPAGRAGQLSGETRPECSDECAAGYYCPPASTSSKQHQCGGPHVYCPPDASHPTLVDAGYYSIGSGADLGINEADSIATRTGQTRCPAGSYCLGGVAHLCASGHYGASPGQTRPECDGLCQPGFWCGRGSTNSTQNACGGVGVYCPAGSSNPISVSEGHYTVRMLAGAELLLALKPAASAAVEHLRSLLAAAVSPINRPTSMHTDGGAVEGLHSAPDPAMALSQFQLVDAVVDAITEAASQTSSTPASDSPSAAPSSSWPPDRPIMLHPSSELFALLPASVLPIPASSLWFQQAVLRRSDVTTPSTPVDLESAMQSASSGTITGATATAVDDAGDQGFVYLLASLDSSTAPIRNAEVQCELGHYCIGGARFECPPGRFGDTRRLNTSTCSGLCAPGYYCPSGTVDAHQHPCGGSDVYCPAGSAAPIPVSVGHYSLNLHFDLLMAGDGFNVTAAIARMLGIANGSLDAYFKNSMLGNASFWSADGASDIITSGRLGALLPLHIAAMVSDYVSGSIASPDLSSVVDTDGSKLGGSGALTQAETDMLSAYGINSSSISSGFALRLLSTIGFDRYNVSALISENNMLVYPEATIDVPLSSTNITTRATQKQCPPGTYCRSGVAILCPGGSYGARSALSSSTCDGHCAPGFYCPRGSTSPMQHECGNESYYCPSGSELPMPVSSGYYSAGGLTDVGYQLDGYDKTYDISGHTPASAAWNFENGGITCDANYTLHGDAHAPGTSRPELTSSECPGGADGDRLLADMASGAAIQDVGTTVIETLLMSIADDPPPTDGVLAAGPTLVVPTIPQQPCASFRSPLLGPTTSISFSRHRSCYGAAIGDAGTRSTQVRCQPGSFCWYGLRFECPPGYYGSQAGASRFECDGACAAGYYCPWGSTSPTQFACGGAALYCPAQSGAPTPVDVGHYSIPVDAPAQLRTNQSICEPGYYCVDGTRFKCPAGRFGYTYGLSSPECSGLCSPGYFCPSASSSPTAVECGLHRGAGVYCPPGSANPLIANEGHYTVGGFERVIGLPENTTRSVQVPCEAGHYCTGGIKYQCPGGSYGSTRHLSSASCSGVCAPGHFCPPGSVSQTECRCGDIYLFIVDVLGGIDAQTLLQSNPFNNSDRVPVTHPDYNASLLYGLYQQLARMSAVSSGLDGSAESGAWRLDVLRGGSTAALQRFDPTGVLSNSSSGSGSATSNITSSAVQSPVYCDYNGTVLTNCSVVSPSSELSSMLSPEQLLIADNATKYTTTTSSRLLSAEDGTIVLQILNFGPSTNGTSVFDPVASGTVAPALNYTSTIKWRSGLRFRLPPMMIPLQSFAAIRRQLLQGGPSGVYCPVGSDWPRPVPLGYYSNTSEAAVAAPVNGSTAASSALLALQYNETRDIVELTQAGHYSIAGIRYPCQAGTYGDRPGLSTRYCSGWCPPGFECPLGTAAPFECGEGYYATGGSAHCIACPVPSTATNGTSDSEFISSSAAAAGGGARGLDSRSAAGDAYSEQQGSNPLYQDPEPAHLNQRQAAAYQRPQLAGDTDGSSTVPASPPLARCRNARSCCGLV